MTSDVDYYRARAFEERERAVTASNPSIANIHCDLAAKYEALAKQGKTRPTLRPSGDGMSDAQPA